MPRGKAGCGIGARILRLFFNTAADILRFGLRVQHILLRSGNRFDTAVGPVSFDIKGDLKDPRLAWFRWIEGRYVEIDPATLAPPILDTTP